VLTCGDGLFFFFEVPPLASDALLTTLHPLLENVLQTVDHFEISCLGALFSWLEKPRNRMGRDLDCMADVLQIHIFQGPSVVLSLLSFMMYEGLYKSFRTGHLERENCKWYNSLPLGAVLLLFCESV
jgi:hypothetical protein